ncbi:RNA-directed DNA polymerase (Reverse transcriptase) [Candidatus Thiomargarita nelsonii]|uniref:RNA-directed DNA polymerase (Reverse transcriptase) n=1 Tax=Candidatus Thiomargarita nelsonii TaxID=1003181 RepID=A0A176RWY8_9GAMM|nr:RNA-directed DNA polymerase (Reverse transcriptase) [Candidatus Thiomargarita nelsonii]
METDLIEHLRGIKGWKSKIGVATVYTKKKKKTSKQYKTRDKLKIDLIRYADDFVVIHEDKEVIMESKKFIGEWLAFRGLTLSKEKTSIVHSTDGFDFLGHHIRHYNNRLSGIYKHKLSHGTKTEQNRAKATHVLRVEPQREKIKIHWRNISDTIGKLKAITPDRLIRTLAPKITGWANYYKSVHSSEAFSKLDHLIWKRLYQWARRRHPNKGKRWIADKYFTTTNGRKWMFHDSKTGRVLKCYSQHKVKTGSYARVGYDRSYYDGDTAYWAERMSNGYGDITPSKAKMLKRQNGICPHCGGRFSNDDLLETHHKTHRSKGGKDKYSNLVLLHRHCHDDVHRQDLIQKANNPPNNGHVDPRMWY